MDLESPPFKLKSLFDIQHPGIELQDVIAFLDAYPESVNKLGPFGGVPLHTAIRTGNIDLVKLLLSRGANKRVSSDCNETCLHVAAGYGTLEMVKLFFSKGDHGALEKRDYYRATPLLSSCRNHRPEVFEFLLSEGADVSVKDRREWSVLKWATLEGNAEVINILIAGGHVSYRTSFISTRFDVQVYKRWKIQNVEYLKRVTEVLKCKYIGIEVAYYILEVYNLKCVVEVNDYEEDIEVDSEYHEMMDSLVGVDTEVLTDTELLKIISGVRY